MFDSREQEEHLDVLNQEGNFAWGVADVPVTLVSDAARDTEEVDRR
jgi:hypothetical protein